MRKLKLQVQLSLDGFIGGANGEMDWVTWNWDDTLKQYVDQLTESIDCILLGRKLAEGFIPHWAGVAEDPSNPEVASGRLFTDTPKVVFTRSLSSSDSKAAQWKNTVLTEGDLGEEVKRLKQKEGQDLIVYGGSEFVSNLIQENLIDEYYLFINPVALGSGLSIFPQRAELTLATSQVFDCGITLLKYESKTNSSHD
ncbi:MAG: dihydrofolate reductase family protein [Bacteroidota bacterium]